MEISDEVIKLALNIKSDENEVVVSGILARNDDKNTKVTEVNDILKTECSRFALVFLNNNNIVPKKHMKGGGVHMNYSGTVALANNFLKIINV